MEKQRPARSWFGAEQIAEIEPLLTFKNEKGEIEGVNYGQISTVVVNSIKEQQAQIEQQGTGEPLILIPYLAADYACYAFQVAEYAKYFTCVSVDPRGAGETDKPAGVSNKSTGLND